MSDKFIPHAPRDLPIRENFQASPARPEGGRKSYIPSAVRGVELRSKPLSGVNYQGVPATERRSDGATEGDLEATRVPSGSHKGKTLLQMLNDHPGYLLHLRDDAFTDDEAFELKVEEFCQKYQHRLERATGGAQASILWAASLAAVRREADQVRFNAAVLIFEAIDFTAATAAAEQKARERWPGGDYSVAVENIPLADLRRALKTEQPNKGIDLRKSASSAPSAATPGGAR